MSTPTVDQVPAEVRSEAAGYVAALEGLVRHAAAVREQWRPFLERYAAWLDRQPGRFAALEAASGMGRAAQLAGAVTRLADESLVVGGADNGLSDDKVAELVSHAMHGGEVLPAELPGMAGADQPERLRAEALDLLDAVAEMLVECWPALGADELVGRSTGSVASIVTALRRGDRAAALLAAETCRRAADATHRHLADPPARHARPST